MREDARERGGEENQTRGERRDWRLATGERAASRERASGDGRTIVHTTARTRSTSDETIMRAYASAVAAVSRTGRVFVGAG